MIIIKIITRFQVLGENKSPTSWLTKFSVIFWRTVDLTFLPSDLSPVWWPWPSGSLLQRLITFFHGLNNLTEKVWCDHLQNWEQGSHFLYLWPLTRLMTLTLWWPSPKGNLFYLWSRQTDWQSLVWFSTELWISFFMHLTFDPCNDLDLEDTFTKS